MIATTNAGAETGVKAVEIGHVTRISLVVLESVRINDKRSTGAAEERGPAVKIEKEIEVKMTHPTGKVTIHRTSKPVKSASLILRICTPLTGNQNGVLSASTHTSGEGLVVRDTEANTVEGTRAERKRSRRQAGKNPRVILQRQRSRTRCKSSNDPSPKRAHPAITPAAAITVPQKLRKSLRSCRHRVR